MSASLDQNYSEPIGEAIPTGAGWWQLRLEQGVEPEGHIDWWAEWHQAGENTGMRCSRNDSFSLHRTGRLHTGNRLKMIDR